MGKNAESFGLISPRRDRQRILKSQIFDAAWYLERYPDAAAARLYLLYHYLRQGASELRDPSPLCSTRAVTPKSTRTIRTRRTMRCCTMSEMADPATRWSAKCDASSTTPGFLTPHGILNAIRIWQLPASIPLIITCGKARRSCADPSPMFYARRYAEEHADDPNAAHNALLHYVRNGGSRDALEREMRRASSTTPGFLTPHGILNAIRIWQLPASIPLIITCGKARRSCAILHQCSTRAVTPTSTRTIRTRRTIRCCTMSEMADPATRWSAKCDALSTTPGFLTPHGILNAIRIWQLPASIPLIITCGKARRSCAILHQCSTRAVTPKSTRTIRTRRTNPLLHYVRNGGSRDALEREMRRLINDSGLFNPSWYLERYPDLAAAGVDPLDHYLRQGASELRDPSPYFSAKRYAREHGYHSWAATNPLVDFIEKGGSQRLPATVMQFFADVVDLDPELARLERSALNLPLKIRVPRDDNAALAWKRLFASLERPYERVIFVPSLHFDRANTFAAHAICAVHERHGAEKLLVVATDGTRAETASSPAPEVHCRALPDYAADLAPSDRDQMVSWLIRALKPKSILNVNSEVCWEVFKTQGRALSTFCDLYAALPGGDCTEYRAAIGFAEEYFRYTLAALKGVYLDNWSSYDALVATLGIMPSLRGRLRIVYQPAPVASQLTSVGGASGRRIAVMASSPLCTPEDVRLLRDTAKLDSDFAFDFYRSGRSLHFPTLVELSKRTKNLVVHESHLLSTESFRWRFPRISVHDDVGWIAERFARGRRRRAADRRSIDRGRRRTRRSRDRLAHYRSPQSCRLSRRAERN